MELQMHRAETSVFVFQDSALLENSTAGGSPAQCVNRRSVVWGLLVRLYCVEFPFCKHWARPAPIGIWQRAEAQKTTIALLTAGRQTATLPMDVSVLHS